MLSTLGFLLIAAFVIAPGAAADGGTVGRVVVPGDHFQPGAEISIAGSQIGGRQVSLQLALGQTTVDLGTAEVALDGTFATSATVPLSFPLGYAELSATDENGNETSTIILIGNRAEGPNGQPGADAPIDDRAIGLTLAGIGTLLFLIAAAWYVRGRPKDAAKPD